MNVRIRRSAAVLLLGLVIASGVAGAQQAGSAALRSYQRARAVLDAGVEALGGADALNALHSIHREYFDTWLDPTQGARPWQGAAGTLPPVNAGFSRTESSGFIDYAGERWLEAQKYVDSPREYAQRLDVVTRMHGFRSITYIEETPFYDAFAADELAAMTTRKFRRHPEGILRMALTRPESLQSLGRVRVAGREQDVISFADPLGTSVFAYFDSKSHLMTRVEVLRDHPVAGDASVETLFSDYRAVGAVKLPFRYLDRLAGVPAREQEMAGIAINRAPPEDRFQPPRKFIAVERDPETPQLQKVSDTLYLIRGAYNVMVSLFPSHVVIFEAPMNDAFALQILRMVRSIAPGKPIRYAVASHFHSDHIGGVRTFVSEGIPILTTPDAKEVIGRALQVGHSMRPDSFSRRPGIPVIETVTQQRVLDEGTVRACLYDVGPAPHVNQILAAYFPDEKLLFVADLLDVLTDKLVIAGVDAEPLHRKILELGLEVDRFVPVHGTPISGEELEAAFGRRAALRLNEP